MFGKCFVLAFQYNSVLALTLYYISVLHYLDSLSVSAVKFSDAYNEKLKEFLRKNYPGFLLTVSLCRLKIFFVCEQF